MAEYEVLAHTLDRIDEDKGYHEDGRPKKVNEHHRGDVVDFTGTPDDRVDELVRQKAIKPKSNKEGGQSAPPAAAKSENKG